MAQTLSSLAPDRLEIDGKPGRLDDGKSLSLPGGVNFFRKGDVYFIGRPGGDVVRADVNSNEYIDVYVGHAPGAKVGGLLGNANGATSDDIAIQAGGTLTQPVSFTDLYGRYADSWRVPPNESLLCKGQKIERGKPLAPIYAHLVLPEGKTPRAWCQCLFQHSAFSGLAETAIEREMVPEEIDRPLDIINNVLPSVYRD
jgi:hypothetical protein